MTFEGKHFQFRNVPMILRPRQRPHPPLWYGTTILENADWPAANGVNIVSIALRATVRVIIDRYRAARATLRKEANGVSLMGVVRHVVVADSDAEALTIARRAYPRWRKNFRWLFARHGAEPRIAALYPASFDELQAIENGVAGSPDTVRDFFRVESEATGANYLLGWLWRRRAMRSVAPAPIVSRTRCSASVSEALRPGNPLT
jgi:alkanesulfonate monooxygenase SsuD/methylene tetrahydromethanopterin reductase-like flavin-dependent oxidoreductase (luciferase family)